MIGEGAYSAVALGGLGLVGAWLKVAPDSRSSVKVAKSLTRIRGSARLLEGIDPTPGSIRFE